MTWVRFEHDCALNPKVSKCSAEAFRMWFNMIGWSAGQGTDGLILDGVPYTNFTTHRAPRALIKELLAAGLLDEGFGGLWVHDFNDYQMSGEAQKRERQRATKRKRDERERLRQHQNHSNVTKMSRRDTPVTPHVTGTNVTP